MSPKVSRKSQPAAAAPEAQPPEAPAAPAGSAEGQLQPESPGRPQPPGPEEPEPEPQPGPSRGFPLRLQPGVPGLLFPPRPADEDDEEDEDEDEEAAARPEALAAQTLGQLEAEAGAPKPPFGVGDQVLSLHGSLLYEAKCLRVAEAACGGEAQAQAGPLTYLIHYTGWNKNWDEWVPASRVFEYSEANLRRQRELLEAHQAQLPPAKRGRGGPRARKTPGLQQRAPPAAAGAGAAALGAGEGPSPGPQPPPPPPPGPAGGRRKRARAPPGPEPRACPRVRADVKVEIPEALKPWLVDDWDLVTKQKQLFALPARKSVDAILEEYLAARSGPGTAPDKAFAAVEVVAGIKEYFNVMLGTQLLYKFERPQYAELLAAHPGAPMSQLYGAPHLLRLFVRLGAMLAYTPLDERSLALLLGHLQDFVAYLADNCAALFSAADYGLAPPDYPDRAD